MCNIITVSFIFHSTTWSGEEREWHMGSDKQKCPDTHYYLVEFAFDLTEMYIQPCTCCRECVCVCVCVCVR